MNSKEFIRPGFNQEMSIIGTSQTLIILPHKCNWLVYKSIVYVQISRGFMEKIKNNTFLI